MTASGPLWQNLGPMRRSSGRRGDPVLRMHLGRVLVPAAGAVAALALGTAFGDIHGHAHQKVAAWAAAAAFLVLAGLAVRQVSSELDRVLAVRAGVSAGSAVRLLTAFSGYVIVLFIALGMVSVPLGHLLVGGALTGVVLGIALQQTLGNVFAGLVLLFARPFVIGDHIRVRSGSLGGPLDGVVAAMGLTYVNLDTSDGLLKVPNSTMLAAAVGPWTGPSLDRPRPGGPPPG